MRALLTHMNIHEGTSVLGGHYCDLMYVTYTILTNGMHAFRDEV